MAQHIKALTSTRAIAAVMVFIHHYGRTSFPFDRAPHLFQSGNLAVSYFFVLSGFVLFIAHHERSINYVDYARRRIARIVPLYLFALFLCVCLPVFLHTYPLPANFVRQIAYSSLFIQSFFHGYPLTLNAPGWTISIELFFYILFPLFLLLQKKNIKLFALLTILLFIASQAVHLWYYPKRGFIDDSLVDFIFFNPFIHINQFLVGMLGGYLFLKLKEKGYTSAWVPTLLFALIILLIAYRPANISYHTGLIAPLFVLLIVSIALKNNTMLNLKGFVFLGDISFGIYILQMPVHDLLVYFNPKYLHVPDAYFFWFSLGILLLFSAICHYIIERPLRKLINP